MATIQEIRSKYPQYEDMSDGQLADALHAKFYSDMPRDQFNAKIGITAPAAGQHLSFEEGQRLLEQEEQAGASGAAGASGLSFLNGVPVAGPAIVGGLQRAAAGASSLMDGESYDTNLKQAQQITQDARDQHPIVSGVSEVAGGIAGTLPLVLAAPAAFGAGGAGLAARSVASAASGGVLGGADAAVRSGGDADAIANGAMMGTGMGLIGPAAGAAIGSGVRKGMNVFQRNRAARAAGTTPYALQKMGQAAVDDGLDAATMRTRLQEMGPDGMIADLGPNLRGKTAALANMPGEGNTIVRQALDARDAGANARLGTVVDETLGPNVVPSQVDNALSASQNDLSPFYGEVFRNARAVNTSPIAEVLDSRIVNLRGDSQNRMREVRRMLNVVGTEELDPNPSTLFETRQAIDGMLSTEANPKVIRNLTDIRGRVDAELQRAVPGVKRVDARFAELARQRDAMGRGQQVLDSGRTAPRPAELAAEMREGAVPQGEFMGPSGVPVRLRQGARAEIDRILGNNRNDISRLNTLIKGDGDWNRDRLVTLFGQERAGRLFNVLQNEMDFASTRNAAVGNSATAGRQQHIQDLGGKAGDGFGVRDAFAAGGVSGAARGAAVKGAERIAQSASEATRNAKNAELARAITSNRAEMIDALTRQINPGAAPALVDPLVRSTLLTAGRPRGE